jgi:uncharacterized LabA/DUF88 family protein
MHRVILYIDGFNLYHGIRQSGMRDCYWLDVEALGLGLLRPGQTLAGVRYFTSRISGNPSDPGQEVRQTAYLDALATRPLVTLLFGQFLSHPVACRSCGASHIKHEEKMTDVNIAMEMLTDAFRDAFDTAILVSGDSDLTGPVARVLTLFPGKRIVIAFPPNRVSKRLKQNASAHLVLGRALLAASQLPDPVVSSTGYPLRRPSTWV